jgi:hypothetical protein
VAVPVFDTIDEIWIDWGDRRGEIRIVKMQLVLDESQAEKATRLALGTAPAGN